MCKGTIAESCNTVEENNMHEIAAMETFGRGKSFVLVRRIV
jgi:hypothetical protein